MPRYIVKIVDDGVPYYLEWSTIVDAPVTYGMSLEEFKEYYKSKYGEEGFAKLDERLERVEKFGSSTVDGWTALDVISGNRAGLNERELTFDEIVRKYIRKETVE
jgi:hypothetical protein